MAEESKTELYLHHQIRELRQRVDRIEAELRALRINPLNFSDCYTIKEAAAAMGVDKQTINRWRKSGKIKSMKEGQVVRIPKSEIEKIFDA